MSIPTEDIYIEKEDEIKLYVIGYETKGESIILDIGGKFVGVIDCYRTNELFITKSILDNMGVRSLNFICWTHTDEDHTKGLSELFQYVDDNTVFIMPEGISYKELVVDIDLKSQRYCNEEIVKIYDLIKTKIKAYNFISANSDSLIYSFNLKSMDDNRIMNVNIESFAPVSSLVRESEKKVIQKLIYDSKKVGEKPNLYSVGLMVKFVEKSKSIKICLTGDVGDNTIKKMHPIKKKIVFDNNYIIKLPHHGSKYSSSIIEEDIVNFFDFAVSTSFKQHNLPNIDVLNKYKKRCGTGIVSKTNNKSGKYGYVVYNIPIWDAWEEGSGITYMGAAGQI